MLGFIVSSFCFRSWASHCEGTWFDPDHFQVHGGVEIDGVVGLRRFVNVGQDNREVAFHRGVELVLGLNADTVGRGIGFVIKSGGRLKGSVGFNCEK